MPLDDKVFSSLMSGTPVAAAPAPDMAGNAITDIIRSASERHGVDPDVMLRLAQRESSLNPAAKNPKSSAGGLFQFIDGTWNQYGRGDKFDPAANADAAARMMRDNLDRFGGNYDAALAAHHVGPGKALDALRNPGIGDVDVSTQKWLAQINGDRQLREDFKAQRQAGALGEDRVEYRPDFAGTAAPNIGSRSALEALGDTGAAALKGIGGLGESFGGLYGLATGDVDPNVVQMGGKALADFAESLKSDFIKNKEKVSQQQIANADGMVNQFATAAWNNLSDPALFVNTFVEQAANFIPGMAAGRIAKGLIAGLGGATSAAAFEAASTAEKAMMIKRLTTAGKVGTGVSVATGAIMQGADAGNSAYQQVMARPQAEWDANPEYQRLVTTLGVQGAKERIGLQEARAAFAKSAVASAGLNSLAPAHAIDKMLVNGIKGRALSDAERAIAGKLAGQGTLRTAATGAAKGFAGEAVSESLDEGYGQYAANQAEAAINPNKDLTDEVGANAGLGFAFGPMGAVGGTFDALGRKKAAQEALANAPASQPNSPLSRAAAKTNLPAIDPRAQPAILGEAPRGDSMADRSGPAPLEGEYMPADGGDKPLLESPGAMVDRHGNIVPGGPNFTTTGEGESPTTAKGNRERQGAASYALGAPRAQLTYQEQEVVSAAEAEYEAAYADLIKAEQLGASDQILMQKQLAARQAEARLQEIHQAIEGNRQQETAAKRDGLLGQVLDVIPPDQNPKRAFDRALRAAGFTDTEFTESERAKIAQWQQLSDSFRAEQEQEASAPNQLDAEAMGIKAKASAQPQGQPGARLREVEAMLNAGMVRRGDRMEDPRTGKVVKLSPAQIARAKHMEKTAERERVLPAYEQAIARRTAELQRLIEDPNHNEDQAVRLSRAIGGLNGIALALKQGASLDDAIASTLGNVPNEVKTALKNPRQDDGAEPAAEVVPTDPVRPNRGGGSALPPNEIARAQRYADDLRRMAPDAGWAEVGGRLIRDSNDNATSRTKWIPRAEWFVAGMLNSPSASVEAVRKAIAGEPMLKPERLHVMGMMDWLDAQNLSEAGQDALGTLDAAISEDSDFGLPDYSAETAAVIELEFAQGSVDVPAFLDAIGENDEQTHVAENEAGAGQAGSATGEGAQTGRQDGQDAPGAGRTGPQSEGFGLTGQTNEQAAAEFAQQQAGEPGDITKAQADKERDAVPFSLAQQSQPKPQGTQVGLFTADGRPTVAAKQEEPKKQEQVAATGDKLTEDKKPTAAEQAAVKSLLKPGDVITQGGWIGVIRDKSIPHPRDGFQFDNPEHGWYIAMYDVDGTKRRGMNKERNTKFMFVRDGVLFDSPMPGWPPTQLHVFGSIPEAQAWAKSDREALAAKYGAESETKAFDEEARAAERQALYEKTREEARANPLRTNELSKVLPEFDAETERMRKAAKAGDKPAVAKDDNSPERLVERAEAVAKKYDDAGYPDHGKIIRASLKTRQPSRDNVEFWESSFDRNLAQWKTIEKANGEGNAPVEPKLRTRADLIEKDRENRIYDMVPDAVINAVLDKLNEYIKQLAAKGLHIDEVDTRFPADIKAIKNNESGLRGHFHRYANQLNAIKRGYKRADEDGFAETEQELSDELGIDVSKLRPGVGEAAYLDQYNGYVALAEKEGFAAAKKQAKSDEAAGAGVTQPGNPSVTAPAYWLAMNGKADVAPVGEGDIKQAAENKEPSLEQQLRDVEDELASQGRVQNARTREKRDQLRKAILERDNPEILKALDGVPDFAEAVVRALQFNTGNEPKADTVRRALKNKGVVEPHRTNMTDAVMSSMGDGQKQDEAEPNLAAAKVLIQEAKDTHGDKRKEAIVRKKARELAQKTPLSDEKTVLALDMVSTRLGMGDGGTKALEFLPSVDGEQNKPASVSGKAGIDSWRSEFESAKKDGDKAKIQALYDKVRIVLNGIAQSHGDKAVSDFNALKKEIEQYAKNQQESAADEQEAGDDAEKLGDLIDYERFVLISADDISKLRKIDVERVLEQSAVKQFRQEFADWIKAKRPDLAQEVDAVLADIAPAMTYDQFKAEMQRLFSLANKYKPGEIGFNEYSAKMADLSDAHPEFSERLDEENDGAQMTGQASDAEGLKAQRAKLFQASENAAQKRLQDEIPNYEQRKSREGVARFNKLRQEEQLKRQSQIDAIQKKIDRLDGGIAPTAAPSSDMDDLKAQMAQAVDELAAILGVKTNLTPEEESQLIPVMAKMFRIAAKMSFVKFKDAARWVLDTIRAQSPETADKLSIDNLQAGYINIAKEIGGNKREALDIESLDDLYSVDADLQGRIEAAEQATNHDATPGQKEAGNYAKGKFPWNGLTISVETAKGEDRTDKETNGDKWRVTMPATYGYILGTKGADGDHLDAFMGDKPDSGAIYVINQTQPDLATFDEHKVMLGYSNEADAKADYLASFSNGFGKKVFGSLEGPFSVAEFKQMLADQEFERREPLDMGRRLDDSTPLSEITVTVEAIEEETGRAVEMDEQADEALKDVDDRMNLARSLLECLAS